jgi:hypothetical protein
MSNLFKYDSRLGVDVPLLKKDWNEYATEEQEEMLLNWEKIRGKIPDRIKELEKLITQKQDRLSEEINFHICCILNTEIAELASTINDLWLWYRVNQTMDEKRHN